ncbi:hypothetical protein PENSPDRAFT_732534 [Peniophora sp. CONT]|nr:hypothetical protein PENSPDRAFT_732534 [Peniophora sp. CONT]
MSSPGSAFPVSKDSQLLLATKGLTSRADAANPPVHGLPFELLAEIFLILHEDASTKESPPPLAPYSAAVSHVCRRWRDVAISCQKLWSTLTFSNREWTELCLARCHTQPLDLHMPLRSSIGLLRNLTPTLEHLRRVRELRIYIDDLHSDFFGLSTMQMGKRNVIHSVLPSRVEQIQILNAAPMEQGLVDVEDALGQQTFPHVNDLSFTLVKLSMPSARRIFTSNLRILTLWNTRVWRDVDEMVHVLELMPRLVDLEYVVDSAGRSHALRTFDTKRSTRYPLRCVRMKYLERLAIGRDVPFVQAMTIFSYISCNTNTSLDITCAPQDDEISAIDEERFEDAIAAGITAIREHFTPALAVSANYASVVIHHGVLKICQPHIKGDFTRGSQVLPVRISFSLPYQPGVESCRNRAIYDRVLDMHRCLKYLYPHAVSLFLDWRFHTMSSTFFTHFDNLRILELDAPHLWNSFVEIFSRNGKPTVLPNLSHLRIACSNYRRSHQEEVVLVLANLLVTRWKGTFRCLKVIWSEFVGVQTVEALREKLGEGRLQCSSVTQAWRLEAVSTRVELYDNGLVESRATAAWALLNGGLEPIDHTLKTLTASSYHLPSYRILQAHTSHIDKRCLPRIPFAKSGEQPRTARKAGRINSRKITLLQNHAQRSAQAGKEEREEGGLIPKIYDGVDGGCDMNGYGMGALWQTKEVAWGIENSIQQHCNSGERADQIRQNKQDLRT